MYNFDSHKFVKEFQKASSKEAQAEVIAKTLVESRELDLSRLATKEQLEVIKQELKQEIVTANFTLLKWMLPFMVGIVGLLINIIVKISH